MSYAFIWFHNNSDNPLESAAFYEKLSVGSPPMGRAG